MVAGIRQASHSVPTMPNKTGFENSDVVVVILCFGVAEKIRLFITKGVFSFWRDRAPKTGQTTTTEGGNGLSPNIFRKKTSKKTLNWPKLRAQTVQKTALSHLYLFSFNFYIIFEKGPQ